MEASGGLHALSIAFEGRDEPMHIDEGLCLHWHRWLSGLTEKLNFAIAELSYFTPGDAPVQSPQA